MKDKLNSLKNSTAKNVNTAEMVTFSLLDNQNAFPFVVSANYPDINISGWMSNTG